MDELSSEKSRRCVCQCLIVLVGFPHITVIGISGSSSRSGPFTVGTKVRSNDLSRRGIGESSQVCLTLLSWSICASIFRNTRVSETIYQGAVEKAPTTGYKWNFASKTSRADSDAIRAVREEVESSKRGGTSSSSNPKTRVLGPSLPSHADRVLAEEEAEERRASELQRKRKRERGEDKDRLEDMVGPKEIGKAGMLEKKRAKRESDKAFREKGDDGMEADDKTLMGGGESFRERCGRPVERPPAPLTDEEPTGSRSGMQTGRSGRRRRQAKEERERRRCRSGRRRSGKRIARRWMRS